MANSALDYMKDVLSAPLGELISSIGAGVADAQAALDAASLAQTLEIYSDTDNPVAQQLRAIGYQPTFYALPETEVEAQVAFSLAASGSSSTPGTNQVGQGKARMYATPMNPSVTNKYNMETSASAKLKFKIVPVPPQGNIADLRVVPNVEGKTKAEALNLLDTLNLNYSIQADDDGNQPTTDDSSVVLGQTPAPGEVLSQGDAVELRFHA